jgi:endoglycosylceramidase
VTPGGGHGRSGPRRAVLLSLALVLVAALAASAEGARKHGAGKMGPAPPLSHEGRWTTDAKGRAVILHGVNVVYKRPPYDPSAIGFGADDAASL